MVVSSYIKSVGGILIIVDFSSPCTGYSEGVYMYANVWVYATLMAN